MHTKSTTHWLLISIALFILGQLNAQDWIQLTSGTTENLYGVAAQNADICYATGTSGIILKTIDGGNNWNQQLSGVNQSIYSICFTDLNNGYAVGNNGSAVRTSDGGLNWRLMDVGDDYDNYRFVYFVSASVGFVTGGILEGDGVIYKTTDAGSTWYVVLVSDPNLYHAVASVYFISDNIGFGHTYGGEIIKTIDGGDTWEYLSTISASTTGTILFFDENNGLLPGLYGNIQKSENGGLDWTESASDLSYELVGLDFFDQNNGYSVGGNVELNTSKIVFTSDGGSTWTDVELSGNVSRLYRVDLEDNTGYVVGFNGTILKYNAIESRLNEHDIKDFNFYPNPVSTFTTIDVSKLNFQGRIGFELFDSSGNRVAHIEDIDKGKFTFNTCNLISGSYIYNIYSSKKTTLSGKLKIE